MDELTKQKIRDTLKRKYANGERLSWNKGKKMSEITKQKQSDSLKEAYKSGKRKSWNKGKRASLKTRIKQREGIKKHLPRTVFKKNHIPYNYNGGKYKKTDGYIMVLCRNHPRADKYGYVREHILVMEKKLRRYLKKTEVIHHINEIKCDNRIENLLLFESKSEHQKHHQKNRRINGRN